MDTQVEYILGSGLNINVCPIPVKTDVGQVDLVSRLSDRTSKDIENFLFSYFGYQGNYLSFKRGLITVWKISWFIIVISDGVLQWKLIFLNTLKIIIYEV
jgi:hypothetical protein